jgi:hypothetical protein
MYCDDTRPDSQLQKATEQHSQLVAILKAQGCSKVSLHVILLGVIGTIYKFHTDTPLSKLGLDRCKQQQQQQQQEACGAAASDESSGVVWGPPGPE